MMATRAIVQRNKYLFHSLNQQTSLVRFFSSFELEQSSNLPASWGSRWGLSHPSSDRDHGKEDSYSLSRKELFVSRPGGLLRHYSCETTTLGCRVGRTVSIPSLGYRWTSELIRYSSTAATGQRENDGKEEGPVKQIKEASPEECDQAVEGLSSVKAKAKAKQLQEPQKGAKSIIKRLWAMLLGIGPGLRAVASMSREDWATKLGHWKDEFKSTLQHYGLVFIIVPFMEFLLPVFLKLFPNMLPSTFQDKMKEQEALKRRLNARIEYAKFLQDTVKEMAKEVQLSRSGEIKKTAEDLAEFMNKVRRGARVSNEEILEFAKLFNDELTLDNISRPRLVNMCKYMGIKPFGTDTYLRYMLRKRLQQIKDDDKMILAEGIDSLSEQELRQACRDRGLLGLRSVEEMRQQLRDWLDLSLNRSVPSSLLILSRAFTVPGKVKPEEAVQATLSSLPDEVVDTVGVTALPSEDSVSERRRKLEFLEMQEELIKEEEEKEGVDETRMKESAAKQKDVALEEMINATAKEAQDQAKSKTLDKQEQLSELSRALAVLASASSVSMEREEFLRLVKKEIELYNSMVEKDGQEGEEAKKAYRAASEDGDHAVEKAVDDGVSSALIDRVDAMLQKLEKEIDDVDAKIGDRWRLLDRDYDGKVTPEEVASAAMYLKDTLGKEGLQELISSLSKDREGKIRVEDIIKLGSRADDANTTKAGKV
ncbi:uncharacterized protein LOC131327406 isoform X2 [Rhododendron vialii]|uniref:uncharacterized protein LOC131327406 isoform X2 n=1 Tax=Rhododendron vialii TaxID=182163 RepID=UPI00265E2ED2|nr:uncharacterized protein LOC131327406 isoform X2 [Rhododendron vialii]